MEKRRYYIAGKVIEISDRPVNIETSRQVAVKLINTRSGREIALKKIIPDAETDVKKFHETMAEIFQQAGKKNYNIVEIIFNQSDIKDSTIERLSAVSISEMLKMGGSNEVSELRIVFPSPKGFRKAIQNIEPVMTNLSSKTFKNPYPAADVIIKSGKGVVLIRRKNFPSGWAIPGGFINYGETAEQAAIRESREETGLDIENLKLFGVYSAPDRDPRFHTISIVFVAEGKGKMKAGDDASRARIFTEENLPDEIAFDHRKILEQFFKTQKKV